MLHQLLVSLFFLSFGAICALAFIMGVKSQ